MNFEEWATREGLDLRKGTESCESEYRDRATHAATLAWAAAVERCAKLCEDHAVVTPMSGKKRLEPSDHHLTESIHDGLVYAAAIRSPK